MTLDLGNAPIIADALAPQHITTKGTRNAR
jgi:hypothetical protein